MHRTVYGWYVGWLKQPCERTEQVDGYGWKPIHRKWSIVGIKLSVQKYNRSSNAFLIGFDHCNHVTSVDWTNLFFFHIDITKKQDEQMTINVVLKPNDASATSVQGWLQNRKLYWYFLHFTSMFLCIHMWMILSPFISKSRNVWILYLIQLRQYWDFSYIYIYIAYSQFPFSCMHVSESFIPPTYKDWTCNWEFSREWLKASHGSHN